MGALSDAVARLGAFLPERKLTASQTIPMWEDGKPQNPRNWHNYYQFALSGYSRNEIFYAGVEELSTSAAEPRLVGVIKGAKGPEQVKDHPLLDLLEHPNPYMSGYDLIAGLIMFRAVAGNAFVLKVRSAAGKVVELWPLRPDRVFVIPDRQNYIGGWEYRAEGETFRLPPEDIIHFRTRNPLDDWYGLPPLAVCAERVDTDAMMRSFTLAFFRNAAVPAGLLNITKQVTTAERQIIRDKLRGETGGPQNWHQMLVLDNTEASFTPMGMPLGQAGIVLPDLDSISEVRILMVLGVPLELIGARTGMVHGNRSTTKEARASFWDETLVPLYLELAGCLTRGLIAEAPEPALDYLEFDLSTVKALQEDEDAKHGRIRADAAAGLISVQEARAKLGEDPEFAPDAIVIISDMLVAQRAEEVMNPPTQPVVPPPPQPPPVGSNGNGHGKPVDLAALKELAAGR